MSPTTTESFYTINEKGKVFVRIPELMDLIEEHGFGVFYDDNTATDTGTPIKIDY